MPTNNFPMILTLITIVVIGVLLFVFVGHPSTPGCGLPHHMQCG